jgi:Fe2+ or Zn2+ uptake regulation protein
MARPSRIPRQIVDLMVRGGRHVWTLEQIAEDLAAAGQGADFSSVWRGVERLLGEGRLTRVGLDDGAARYELAEAHHDHVRCLRCHAVAAIPCLLGPGVVAAMEARTGYLIQTHSVVLDGLCPACRGGAAA